jgi:hypothetical protein
MAQEGNRIGNFRGRLLDSLTGLPIAGAAIEIDASGLRQFSDSSGRFMFAARPVGQHVIRARHLGYREATDTVQIREGDSAERGLVLRRVPQALGEIVVSGRAVTFPRYFEPAYKRAASGRGFFVTREDIVQWNAKDYEAILNRIPGVSANNRGVTFQRCQNGFEVFSNPNLTAKVQVWIDGHRVAIGRDDPTGLYNLIGSVPPHTIQLIEVYPSTALIPAEFLVDACAVIVIWTKRD